MRLADMEAIGALALTRSGELLPLIAKSDGAATQEIVFAFKGAVRGQPLLNVRVEGSTGTSGQLEIVDAAGAAILSGELEAVASGEGRCNASLALVAGVNGTLATLEGVAIRTGGSASEAQLTTPIRLRLHLLPAASELPTAGQPIPVELLLDAASVSAPVEVTAKDLALAPPWAQGVNAVFRANPPRYDVWGGRSFYLDRSKGWDKLVFLASRYHKARQDPNSLINCYDCAAYLQTLLKAHGPTRYLYMQPFGYLRTTHLIGRGPCNNPFTHGSAPLVVPNRNPKRTWFGNHAFCAVTPSNGAEHVVDACAGPQFGTTRQNYVRSAVDDDVPPRPGTRPGKVSDIEDHAGVIGTRNLVSLGAEMSAFLKDEPSLALEPNRAAFQEAIEYAPPKHFGGMHPVRVPDPRVAPMLGNLEFLYEDTAIGFPESSREWRFSREALSVVITVYIGSGADVARERFLLTGETYQSPEPIYGRGPDDLGEIAAKSVDEAYPTLFWLQQNAVFILTASDVSFDLESLARWLRDEAGAATKALSLENDERLRLRISHTRLRVGQRLSLSADVPGDFQIDFAASSDALVLLQANGLELLFEARLPGPVQIAVAAMNPETMVSRQATEAIEVVE